MRVRTFQAFIYTVLVRTRAFLCDYIIMLLYVLVV